MTNQHIADALRRTAEIVGAAGLDERFQLVAFRVVAEVLLRERVDGHVATESSSGEKAKRLQGAALNEFLAGLRLRSHPDRFAAIAYYLLHNRGQTTFNIQDLQAAYTLARQPKPANYAATAGQCARRGFFTETGRELDGHKEWQITTTGEAHVEQLQSEKR